MQPEGTQLLCLYLKMPPEAFSLHCDLVPSAVISRSNFIIGRSDTLYQNGYNSNARKDESKIWIGK